MGVSKQSNSSPLVVNLLSQSTRLGIAIVVVFGFGAGLTYLLLGLVGWQGDSQVILAMFLGPLVGIALGGLIGLLFKPYIVAALKSPVLSQETENEEKPLRHDSVS